MMLGNSLPQLMLRLMILSIISGKVGLHLIIWVVFPTILPPWGTQIPLMATSIGVLPFGVCLLASSIVFLLLFYGVIVYLVAQDNREQPRIRETLVDERAG